MIMTSIEEHPSENVQGLIGRLTKLNTDFKKNRFLCMLAVCCDAGEFKHNMVLGSTCTTGGILANGDGVENVGPGI